MVLNPRALQLAVTVVTLAVAQATYAQVYKWIDEKGVVNYRRRNTRAPNSTRRTGRVSTVESYNYARNLPSPRERALQDRADRLEQEAARNRQTAAQQEAAAEQGYLQWREACIAQRRVDCDDPQ